MFHTRAATVSDIPEMNDLYRNTVLSVNLKDYSIEEVQDWASCADNKPYSQDYFGDQNYIVAVNDEKQIVGFASINNVGYMHTLFVHKDYQGQGVATLLYNTLERYAKENGVVQLTSEVSITAKPFFEKQDWVVDAEQKRKANKLSLTNYKMSKLLK